MGDESAHGALTDEQLVERARESHRDGRGARPTKRDEGAYWAYSTEEQRGQTGCIARRMQWGLLPRAVRAGVTAGGPVRVRAGAGLRPPVCVRGGPLGRRWVRRLCSPSHNSGGAVVLPAVIVDAGPAAVERFLEFFAARIANRRTRAAYGRAVGQFLAWCEARGLALAAVSPLHVAAYIRTHPGSAPTVKQHLAAIRMLGDWLVVSQVLPVNPAAAVRGPKHVVTTGATPVLSPAEARRLLEEIDRHGHARRPARRRCSSR